MCGIVGYVGPKEPVSVLLTGLKKLEYRGYDSSGIALVEEGDFVVYRSVGKLSNLEGLLREADVRSEGKGATLCAGLGHTRWATHGRPTLENAHPHVAGGVCVVHNGIIENYDSIKRDLIEDGCQFSSETDSEVLAQLIDMRFRELRCPLKAIEKALSSLEGGYAFVVAFVSEPQRLFVARKSIPVVLGLGEGENYVASDILALLDYTKDFVFPKEGDIGILAADGLELYRSGELVEFAVERVDWDPFTASKGGYRHFMMKEINEQPIVAADLLGNYSTESEVSFGDEGFDASLCSSIRRICAVGCGTAWHAALVFKYFAETLLSIPVEVDYGSEFRYRSPVIDADTLFVAISQSGETADTLAALDLAASLGAATLAICNVQTSSIARKARYRLLCHAGPEISVASTKAFTSQLLSAYLLVLHMAALRARLSAGELKRHIRDLRFLPNLISRAIAMEDEVSNLARKHAAANSFLFLGRGLLYPIALEGALKLKELSYVSAHGYPAGEMKHGPIALVSETTPVIVLMNSFGSNYEKTLSNLREVESRGARAIAIVDRKSRDLEGCCEDILCVGDVPLYLSPLLFTIPLQLLAYYSALYRGTDVDQPRNLAKSVTVE